MERFTFVLTGHYDSIADAVKDAKDKRNAFFDHYNTHPGKLKMEENPFSFYATKFRGKFRVTVSWDYWCTEKLYWPPISD